MMDENQPDAFSPPPSPIVEDRRMYVGEPETWEARVKRDSQREYCYARAPGENHFHLLIGGEVYLMRGHEKYCLNCAIRHGFVTSDRMHWQKGPRPA